MTKNVSESSFNASRSRYSTIPRGSCPPRDLKSHRIRVAALQTVALTHPAHVDASRIKVAVGSKKIQEVFTGEQKSVFRHNRLPKCQFRQRTPLTTRTSIYNKKTIQSHAGLEKYERIHFQWMANSHGCCRRADHLRDDVSIVRCVPIAIWTPRTRSRHIIATFTKCFTL